MSDRRKFHFILKSIEFSVYRGVAKRLLYAYLNFQIGYYLDEESGWSLCEDELERRLEEAKKHCEPRVLVVINPGNPTGQVLTRENIEMVLRFAHRHNLLIIADEVYQHNIYAPDRQFHSFKRVLHDLGGNISQEVQLASTMSASKGFMGEYVPLSFSNCFQGFSLLLFRYFAHCPCTVPCSR